MDDDAMNEWEPAGREEDDGQWRSPIFPESKVGKRRCELTWW
jgi:hypothetical protein